MKLSSPTDINLRNRLQPSEDVNKTKPAKSPSWEKHSERTQKSVSAHYERMANARKKIDPAVKAEHASKKSKGPVPQKKKENASDQKIREIINFRSSSQFKVSNAAVKKPVDASYAFLNQQDNYRDKSCDRLDQLEARLTNGEKKVLGIADTHESMRNTQVCINPEDINLMGCKIQAQSKNVFSSEDESHEFDELTIALLATVASELYEDGGLDVNEDVCSKPTLHTIFHDADDKEFERTQDGLVTRNGKPFTGKLISQDKLGTPAVYLDGKEIVQFEQKDKTWVAVHPDGRHVNKTFIGKTSTLTFIHGLLIPQKAVKDTVRVHPPTKNFYAKFDSANAGNQPNCNASFTIFYSEASKTK